MEHADKDKDGKLTKEEFVEFAWGRLIRADKDQDGAISKSELQVPAHHARFEGGHTARTHEKNDHDGAQADHSPREHRGMGMHGLGSGRPGRPPIGGRGFAPRIRNGISSMLINRFDRNNDGKLSKDEVPAGLWQGLSASDKDSDGAISSSELEAHARGGHRPGDRPDRQSPEKPADRPAGQPEVNPGGATEQKPAENSAEKPADQPSEKPADKPADPPAAKPEDKSDAPNSPPSEVPSDSKPV